MPDSSLIVAIDGPSGAGKSTLGKLLARELGALYIDTGAMYRAVALAVSEQGVDPANENAVIDVARKSHIGLVGDPASLRVSLDGHDVTDKIRTEAITQLSSVVSAISEVRRILVERQRQMGSEGSVVMDGRDIGTVVFPNADYKFFLTANPERRAMRRFEEIRMGSSENTFEATLADINVRDARDTTRADSPLVPADDAIHIDSTELSISDVLARMLNTMGRERP